MIPENWWWSLKGRVNYLPKIFVQSRDTIWLILCKSRMICKFTDFLWRTDFLDILHIVIRQQNFCSNRKMCPSLKRAWIFLRKVHESLAKKSPKIVSLVKEKLVVVIDRVRYLPLCPEPKGQFTPIIFFLTNPGTPREKKAKNCY